MPAGESEYKLYSERGLDTPAAAKRGRRALQTAGNQDGLRGVGIVETGEVFPMQGVPMTVSQMASLREVVQQRMDDPWDLTDADIERRRRTDG